MDIRDLKPAWESFKVRNSLMAAQLYDSNQILQLLEPAEKKAITQKVFGAGVMLALILFFCQGG